MFAMEVNGGASIGSTSLFQLFNTRNTVVEHPVVALSPQLRAFRPDCRVHKGNKLYRYYVSQAVLKHGPEACPVRRVPAAEIEAAVVDQLRAMLRSPEVIVATWRAARSEIAGLAEDTVGEALERLDPLGTSSSLPSKRALSSCWLSALISVSMASKYISARKALRTHFVNWPA